MLETNITKAIRGVLLQRFPVYAPKVIEKALEEITSITGAVDYRALYVDLVEESGRPERKD